MSTAIVFAEREISMLEYTAMSGTIALLTDFGNKDSYVAEVKGVLRALVPQAVLVDITHEVPSFQIEEAAFLLLRSFRHFPKGTWFLGIVDPGVGSERRCLYLRTRRFHFVGPDNGLLSWAVEACEREEGKRAKAFEIAVSEKAAVTFHGRDVFAPFIGKLLGGRKIESRPVKEFIRLAFPMPSKTAAGWKAPVLSIDKFGNLVTSLPVKENVKLASFNGYEIFPASCYAQIKKNSLALIRGSHGYWEIAANQVSAQALTRAKRGEFISIQS